MPGQNLLVVDDDPSSSAYMSLALEQAGHRVQTASSAIEALVTMERAPPALVVTDLQMPDIDGLELLVRIKERWPQMPVMLITVEEEIATVVEAIQRGAVNYLVKPVSLNVLQAAVSKALTRNSGTAVAPSDDQASEIIGVSPAIVRVRHLVGLAARSDVNVIITGETGTGKELVARALHRLSGIASGPFLAHNCALTSPEMFDSEFFGHRRGAFTGADRDRVGILREADGGFLFLDELECLNLTNQAKLLRVLDDGEIRPVGSDQSRAVAVRFIAATNRAPDIMIARGELREDLYYRLRGFQVELPPLRERRQDIALLADHFLAEKGARLSAPAMEIVAACSWPGNARQLRNVLRSACAVAGAQSIEVRHLDLAACGTPGSPGSSPSSQLRSAMSLEETERRAIEEALRAYGGNLSRAAAALGIHRSTLRRKLGEPGPGRKR